MAIVVRQVTDATGEVLRIRERSLVYEFDVNKMVAVIGRCPMTATDFAHNCGYPRSVAQRALETLRKRGVFGSFLDRGHRRAEVRHYEIKED